MAIASAVAVIAPYFWRCPAINRLNDVGYSTRRRMGKIVVLKMLPDSPSGRNRKPVSVVVLVLLGAVILTSGCAFVEKTLDPHVSGSLSVSGSDDRTANSPVNDTIPGTSDSLTSAKLYDYEADLQQLPEVSTGVMKQSEIDRYRILLGKLNAKDPGAARWVAGMGLFAEDRKISDDEIAFSDAVAQKEDPLRLLVTPWVRGGISSQGAGWAADTSFPSGEFGYLTDDLQQIESQKGPADPETKERLKSIIKASETDYELRKGLCIMDEYGVPGKNVFSYRVPAYNTQLDVLLDLLNKTDIPPEYYRLALAAGIDYGAIETIGDSSVRANLSDYIRDTVAFTMETDRMIHEKGAGWQAADYPLEADIALLWGAAGTMRPFPCSREDYGNPDMIKWNHPSFEKDFYSHPMSMTDFEWSFVAIRNLKEMREMMIAKSLPSTIAAYSETGYRGTYSDYENARNYSRRQVNYTTGNPLYLRDKTNVNMDWDHYQTTGSFDSACYSEDLSAHGIDENACYDKPLDEKTLERSINIAGFLGTAMKNRDDSTSINKFIPLPATLTFDQNGSLLRAFPEDIRAIKKYNAGISHHTHPISNRNNPVLENMYFAIVHVPWDNFSDKELFSRIYMDGTTPFEYNKNVVGGYIPTTDAIRKLPSGYLFRHPYAAVIDYEKA
jgi:hypothetical protein